MEMIYRGYPYLEPEVKNSFVSDAVSADRKSIDADAIPDRRKIRKETEYLKGLYPVSVRKSQVLVDEWFDRYEHPGSPLYDEYPDREWLIRLRDRIWDQARELGTEPLPELLYVLMVSEMGRRRMNRL